MTLIEQLIKLYESVCKQEASSEIIAQLEEIIDGNNLKNDGNVPKWFKDMFAAILEGKETGRVRYEYDQTKGDTVNFLAELEEIIPAEWDDYGEAVGIVFRNMGLYVCVSLEGEFYEVKKEIPHYFKKRI